MHRKLHGNLTYISNTTFNEETYLQDLQNAPFHVDLADIFTDVDDLYGRLGYLYLG